MVGDIEAELHGMGQPEVPSQLIGERIMTALRDVDEVAYVRFASVYREFRDVDEVAYVRFASVYREFRDVDTIVDEIEGLRKWKRRLIESRNQLRFRFEEEQTCWS
jgi:transcriptional regulator NrdR family protein